MGTKSITAIFFISLVFTFPLAAEEISLMSYNVENLFDNKDDIGKDDKAFLPASFKRGSYHKGHCKKIEVKKWRDECLYLDWNEEAKTKKILNIAKVVSSFGPNGADIIAFQEIENINVLRDLYNELEPLGYLDFVLFDYHLEQLLQWQAELHLLHHLLQLQLYQPVYLWAFVQ